jgi:uncharacterized protein YjbJ (UPF0337 family)
MLDKGGLMNRDMLKGQWKQVTGEIKRRWSMLTDDDLGQVEGSFEKLAGRIQERYGYGKEQAERELDDFLNKYPQPVGSTRMP